MINFMGGTGTRQGFREDDSKGSIRPFSQSSSSCSSSPASSHHHHHQHRGHLVPLSHHQVQSRGPWDESSFRPYSGDCGGGGGGASQPDLSMMGSSSSPTTTNINNNVADHESDDHPAVRRGVDISGGGGSTSGMMIEREQMFDKVVTPSDVGKLNRLVIPKQHAEKYFPLDSSNNEKGLLLNFEDRNGKPWRFRYSYWNSSQSYVMTKGWSRFVKEKKLDAGDVVSFQRGVGELGKDRLYIDWRRRPDVPDHHHHHHHFPASIPTLSLPHQFSFHHPWTHPFYLQQQSSLRDHSQLLQVNANINSTHPSHHSDHPHPHPPPHHHCLNANSYGYSSAMTGNPYSSSIIYLRSAETGAAARPQQIGVGLGMEQLQKGTSGLIRGTEEQMVFESVPVVQGKAAAKRLRLFGVNMDCPISESEDDECDILSSTAAPHSTMPSSQSHFSSSISPMHLRSFNGSPLLQTMPTDDLLNKGKAPMSLDFDI